MADLIFDTSKATLLGLSEASNGQQLNMTGAAAPASALLLHRATSEQDEVDEVTIELSNMAAGGTRTVYIAWAAAPPATAPTSESSVAFQVPVNSTLVAIDRRRLKGGLCVYAFCGAGAADINVYGEVNRYKAQSSAAK